MTTFYDDAGNPIEGLVTPDEFKKLQEEKQKAEEELDKFKKKDFNFRKLEEMTEEEKKKLSATELELKKQQEELQRQHQEFESTFVRDIKNDVLDSLVGEDPDLRAKVEANFSRITDSSKAKSRSEIKTLMSEALNMTGASKSARTNPVLSANNYSSNSSPAKKREVFSESEEGIALAKKLGLSFIKEQK